MTIVIAFKNGYELKTKCEKFNATRDNVTGRITGITYDGVTENKPLDVDFNEVLCIYRIMSDEVVQ